jgi:hypothetical protein
MADEMPQEIVSTAPQNSTLAIISLVAGILGLTFFPLLGCIVAIITGFLARKEIKESSGALGGEGIATAGLVLGFIGIGLGALGFCIVGSLFGLSFCFFLSEGNYMLLPGLFSMLL